MSISKSDIALNLPRSPEHAWSIYSLLLAGLGTMILTVHVLHYNFLSVLFTFLILYFIGFLSFLKSGKTALLLFQISFVVNTILAVGFVFYFENTIYMPFSGGDDRTFYFFSKEWSYGLKAFNEYAMDNYGSSWGSVNYQLYIIIFGSWLKLLRWLSFDGDHFFNLNIINYWFGALIAPLAFLIGKKVMSTKVGMLTAIFILVYTPITFYSIIIIRDTLIGAMFLLIVWIMVKDTNTIVKILLYTVLLYLIYRLRVTSAFFVFIFLFSYWFFTSRVRAFKLFSRKLTPLIILIVVGLSMVLAATNMAIFKSAGIPILNKISYYFDYYKEHSLDMASSSSMGSILKQSNNPIIFVVLLIYTYLSPLPPEFVKGLTVRNAFIGVGNMVWYLVAPTFIIAACQFIKGWSFSNLMRATLTSLSIALIFVSMTSGNARHLYFIHPIIGMFAINYAISWKRQFTYLVKLLMVVGTISFIVYSYLKFL